MRVLVIGSGGREHALAWRLERCGSVDEVFTFPGNDGMRAVSQPLLKKPLANWPHPSSYEQLAGEAAAAGVDLVIVGPEAPLVDGLADVMRAQGLAVFGPGQAAAKLEGSKAFTKQICDRTGVPTGRYNVFSSREAAVEYLYMHPHSSLVIKADGLAAGKGVTVAHDRGTAVTAVKQLFARGFDRLVIEEFLAGEELSLMALVDGSTVVPLATSRDHKALEEGNQGPNTGGMGAVSPAPGLDEKLVQKALETIIQPVASALDRWGIGYRGLLYAGLMITSEGPKLLEFNVRLGDPEAQVILSRWQDDVAGWLLATAEGRLAEYQEKHGQPNWSDGASACVIAASPGYPGDYRRGLAVEGLDETGQVAGEEKAVVFHAGLQQAGSGWRTSGGRVLGVTCVEENLAAATGRVYQVMDRISFEGMQVRRDIGQPDPAQQNTVVSAAE